MNLQKLLSTSNRNPIQHSLNMMDLFFMFSENNSKLCGAIFPFKNLRIRLDNYAGYYYLRLSTKDEGNYWQDVLEISETDNRPGATVKFFIELEDDGRLSRMTWCNVPDYKNFIAVFQETEGYDDEDLEFIIPENVNEEYLFQLSTVQDPILTLEDCRSIEALAKNVVDDSLCLDVDIHEVYSTIKDEDLFAFYESLKSYLKEA